MREVEEFFWHKEVAVSREREDEHEPYRVFRICDPHADALQAALASLNPRRRPLLVGRNSGNEGPRRACRHKPSRSLDSNIEMNAALLLDTAAVPRDTFTHSRSPAGWLANAMEQQKTYGPSGVKLCPPEAIACHFGSTVSLATTGHERLARLIDSYSAPMKSHRPTPAVVPGSHQVRT